MPGNGTNAAKDMTMRLYKDGGYLFRVTATDPQGYSAVRTVRLIVKQTARRHATDSARCANRTRIQAAIQRRAFGSIRTPNAVDVSIILEARQRPRIDHVQRLVQLKEDCRARHDRSRLERHYRYDQRDDRMTVARVAGPHAGRVVPRRLNRQVKRRVTRSLH